MSQALHLPEKIQKDLDNLMDPLTEQQQLAIWAHLQRMTVEEGLAFFKAHGYEIQRDRYNQIWTQVNKIIDKRLLYETAIGFIQWHFRCMDELAMLQDMAYKDLKNSETTARERTLIRKEISERIPLITAYKEHTQYVIEKQLKNRKLVKDLGVGPRAEKDLVKISPELADELGITDKFNNQVEKIEQELEALTSNNPEPTKTTAEIEPPTG